MTYSGAVFLLVVATLGTTKVTSADTPKLCDSPQIDAAVSDSKYSYIIRGDYVWQIDIDENVVREGLIGQFWSNASAPVDAAAYHPPTKSIYLFSGDNYSKYTENGEAFEGYPKLISDGFHGIPCHLDAAIVWPINNRFYFMRGDKYAQRTGEFKRSRSDMPMTSMNVSYGWPGVPANVDAIFQFLNGHVYIFKGEEYYRFDQKNNKVYTKPSYPRKTLEHWFNCPRDIATTTEGNIMDVSLNDQ